MLAGGAIFLLADVGIVTAVVPAFGERSMAGRDAEVDREAARLLDEACLRGGSPAALAQALQSLGGLDVEGSPNPVAQYATR